MGLQEPLSPMDVPPNMPLLRQTTIEWAAKVLNADSDEISLLDERRPAQPNAIAASANGGAQHPAGHVEGPEMAETAE